MFLALLSQKINIPLGANNASNIIYIIGGKLDMKRAFKKADNF